MAFAKRVEHSADSISVGDVALVALLTHSFVAGCGFFAVGVFFPDLTVDQAFSVFLGVAGVAGGAVAGVGVGCLAKFGDLFTSALGVDEETLVALLAEIGVVWL